MSDRTIGIAISSYLQGLIQGLTPDAMSTAPIPARALAAVRKAEDLDISAVWSPSPGLGDALTLLTAAAAQTQRILLGTSIVQTWLRHPVSIAQEAQVAGHIAPGRFRLGLGPGHGQMMESKLGVDFRAPLGHLKEYLRIVKGLLQDGEIDCTVSITPHERPSRRQWKCQSWPPRSERDPSSCVGQKRTAR